MIKYLTLNFDAFDLRIVDGIIMMIVLSEMMRSYIDNFYLS